MLVKLNIVNLNRQSNMYSQGMAPVCRTVPGRNQWERVRDKPTYSVCRCLCSFIIHTCSFFSFTLPLNRSYFYFIRR